MEVKVYIFQNERENMLLWPGTIKKCKAPLQVVGLTLLNIRFKHRVIVQGEVD